MTPTGPDESGELDMLLEAGDTTLLDIVDHVLNKGVVLTAEVVLSVAGVDLIHLRLQAVLAASDKLLPGSEPRSR